MFRYNMRYLLWIIGIACLPGCSGSADPNELPAERVSLQEPVLADTADALHLTGAELAKAYCQACHAYPAPELLDKQTWKNGVLPNMALRLGLNLTGDSPYQGKTQQETMDLLQAGIYPDKPLITQQEWAKIEAYYLEHAPEKMELPAKGQAEAELSNFTVVIPDLNKGRQPLTTLVKYLPASQSLWVGDSRNWLFRLNNELQVVDSIQLVSPPVDLLGEEHRYKVLSIGTMAPSERSDGQLFGFSAPATGATPLLLLDKLRRPVQMVEADFNGDKLQDLVVCHFGNNLGALVLYLNMGKKYRQVMLKELPGAIKAEVTDLNQDGLQDIVVLFAQGTEAMKVFYNRGGTKFEERNLIRFPPVYGLSYFELADLNQDGFPDILLSNGDNADYSPVIKPYHGIRIYLNDGKNNFREAYFYPMPGASKVLARDFDLDGDLDIAAISFFPDFNRSPEKAFVYLEQAGKLDFRPKVLVESQLGHWLTLEAGDTDGDGDLDIVLGSFTGTPAPKEVQEKWVNDGPGIIVLQNKTRQKHDGLAASPK
jgi:cytochrome c5